MDNPTQERDVLANAIAQAAIKAGIITGEPPLTGPQLIQLCDDLGGSERPLLPRGYGYNRETVLAQHMKELYEVYCGNDHTCWPERSSEFRRIASQAAREKLWESPDWICTRCQTMNTAKRKQCRM